jgi:hypothetical protein
VSIFIDPFDVGGWRLVLVLMTLSAMAAIFIDVAVATPPQSLLSLRYHGTTDEVGVAHWIVYVWMSILSIVIMALYTSVMSQILLLNTKGGHVCEAYDQGAEISVTRDVAEQLTLSNSPFALALNGNFRIVAERDALESLPVVSWPVSSMMKQMSCKDLDLAYRGCPRSVIPHWRVEVPDWFYDDVKDAVFTRKFPKLSSPSSETRFL